jgi:stage II sporulation protein D
VVTEFHVALSKKVMLIDSLRRSLLAILILCSFEVSTLGVALRESTPTVRVRIFSSQILRSLTIDSASSLHIGNATTRGPLRLTGDDGEVSARAADRHWLDQSLWVRCEEGSEMSVLTNGGTRRRLVGLLEILNRNGQLLLINTMPRETYVLGIIQPELGSAHAPMESIKAQLIVSRSYVMAMRGRHAHDGYDFCDSTHCQVFGGMAAIGPALLAISPAVRGQYLAFHNHAIPAFYHDSCGGMTATAEDAWGLHFPYLKNVRDGEEPSWRRHIRGNLLQKCLVREGIIPAGAVVRTVSLSRQDASGRVKTVSVETERKKIRVSGSRFRVAVNSYVGHELLPSTLFLVSRQGPDWIISGRGWGHGVGMCQRGAMVMAKEGHSYRQILQHYYPGTHLKQEPSLYYASASQAGA